MLNARYSFALLWQRLVAALSLVMAASLAPASAVSSVAGAGAGAIGSRAAVSSAANALAGNVAPALVEGEQHRQPLDTSAGGAKSGAKSGAKAFTVAAWQEVVPRVRPGASCPPLSARAAPQAHPPRSGPARAPPA